CWRTNTPDTSAAAANPQPSQYPRYPSLASIARSPSPALGERRHRCLACRLTVRGALDVPTVAARPHPGAALRRSRLQMEDAANDLAVFEHVVIVVAPTRWIAALEDQLSHGSANRARK